MTEVTYSLGAALRPHTHHLDLGADHPSRAGLVEVVTTQEGGLIKTAEIRPGAIHRSVEKLFEVRDYRQLLSLANRHDWQASFVGELGAALTIEAALGLEPPPRATWLRTMLAELSRLGSHLAFLTAIPDALVADAGVSRTLRQLRTALRQLIADYTGNRIHPMVIRLGGLALDAPTGWAERAVALARTAAIAMPSVIDLLHAADFPKVACLDAPTIATYGVTGPAARASGVDLDLRRLQPYLAYPDLTIVTPTAAATGDAAARLSWWAAEVVATSHLIEQIAPRLQAIGGEVGVKLPKIVRVPEGETYCATEAPLGHAGWWLVSRGDKVPWRFKLRTPSFANLTALESVLPGTPAALLPLAVASLGYVVGDVAK